MRAKKIIQNTLLTIIFIWLAIALFDFFRVTMDRDPLVCIKNEVIEYFDGNVYKCTGLGYVAFKYDRESLNMRDFGPIYFTEEKQPEEWPDDWMDDDVDIDN